MIVRGIVSTVLAGLFAAFIVAFAWTAPGPAQARHLRIIKLIAIALAVVIIAFGIASGLAEGFKATPESDSNQFGAGYVVVGLIIALPFILLDMGLFGLVLWSSDNGGTRLAWSLGTGVVAGLIAWAGFIWMMSVLERLAHP